MRLTKGEWMARWAECCVAISHNQGFALVTDGRTTPYLAPPRRPYLSKIRSSQRTVVARPAWPIDLVSGIFLGQTATQFCALPHD
jgi:hypothetical protein